MFNGLYHDWNQKRIKGIVDHYGYKFFYGKKIADLGCGYADLGGVIYRLGAEVIAIDARQEHLKIVEKKFPGIKTQKLNLDSPKPFNNQKFDVILDLGLLCHLSNYEEHLKTVCAATDFLVLETAVSDSSDPFFCLNIPEGKEAYDLSYNGQGSRPSAAAIERVLTNCGMSFKRMDNSKFNSSSYTYDWQAKNNNSTDIYKRRIWFASKNQISAQNFQPLVVVHPPASSNPNPQPITTILNTTSGSDMTFPKVYTRSQPYYFGAQPAPAQPPKQKPLAPTNYPAYMQTAPTIYNNTPGDKRFVIVIPSYKNENYCENNIRSAINQNYKNYRIIFTDDCSPDNTFNKVSEIVNSYSQDKNITLIKNTTRIGALANLYNMICSCDDDEIILTLDGDDWFPDGEVLNKLNNVYKNNDVWMTYGQYRNSHDGHHGVAQQYPDSVIQGNLFRNHVWGASHLRTFYTWLFKKINKNDLMYNGSFFSMAWDMTLMFPMLEMSGFKSKYINDILYVYNMDNPINDHKVDVGLQQRLDGVMRSMPKYQLLPNPPKTTIGLMMIATGKYDRFIQGLITSADNYFLNNPNYEITYYIFTDKQPNIVSKRNVVIIPIDHKPFPHASMDRFKHFINHADKLTTNFLFYCDVDSLFVNPIGEEILGNLVGVRHCGYYPNHTGGAPFENNPNSCIFINGSYPRQYKYYYGGGFSGGRHNTYLQLAKKCMENIEKDLANNIINVHHDESQINKYFLDHEPDISLTPAYHYPQSNIEHYKSKWNGENFEPKILLLDKNHDEIRS